MRIPKPSLLGSEGVVQWLDNSEMIKGPDLEECRYFECFGIAQCCKEKEDQGKGEIFKQ